MSKRRLLAGALSIVGIATFGGVVASQSEERADSRTNLEIDIPSDFVPLPRLSAEPDPEDRWPIKARAWGDSAAGCVLVAHELAAPNLDPDALVEGLEIGISAADLSIEAELEANSSGQWTGFLTDPVEGPIKLFVQREGKMTHASAVACFWGERDPERCRKACEEAIATAELVQ